MSTLHSDRFFTPEIRQCLVIPKNILHQEIIRALRDCPDNPLFLTLLVRHSNASLFAGVRKKRDC